MRAALLSLVVLALPAYAAPAIKASAVDVQPGGFAMLAVDGATAATSIWSVTPDAIQEAEIAGVYVFTGKAGTTYTVTALVVDFAAQKVVKLKQTVRFLGDVPPGPPPTPVPPTPVPPTPDPPKPPPLGPLAQALKDAAKADGLSPDRLYDLWSAFKVAADGMKDRTTVADVQSSLAAVLKNKLPTKPANVWAVIQKQLAGLESVAPSDQPDKTLSDSDKAAVAAVFQKIADACKGASQ